MENRNEHLTRLQKKQIHIALVILFNVVVVLAFVGSSLSLVNSFNHIGGYGKTEWRWTPFSVDITAFATVSNGDEMLAGHWSYINYPFILFWISISGNLMIIVWLLREKMN